MNILMVHPHDLFSPTEPWTIRIKKIAQELKNKGHQVKVIYFPLVFHKEQECFSSSGIKFIPLSRELGKGNFIKNIRFFIKESKKTDIIHFQKCFYYAAIPALIGGFLNKKHLHYDWDDWEIKIFHASAKQPWLVGLFLGMLERLIPGLCDTVSVSSLRLKQECLNYGINEERIFMAPVGADLDFFHPRISALRIQERYNLQFPLITYVGQLHGGQYVEQFIRAAKIVLNKKAGVRFMIVGGGYQLPKLKKITQDLSLSENIIFTDYVPHQEIPLFIAAADIAIACFEDNDITRCKSPLKIAEYMACGKPIVASNVGEVKRMLGGAGIVTEPGNSEDLARGIIKLLEDEPLRKRLSIKARLRAEEIYNWANTTQNILSAYEIV